MAASTITRSSTMQDILTVFPGAKRALFQRYHIGGCSSCGFQPQETLEQVLSRHNVLDVEEVLGHLRQAEELDRKLQVKPEEVKKLLAEKRIRLLDVRSQEEWEAARIEGAELVTQELVQEMLQNWKRDTAIVFHCHHGMRSLDAAAYFIGHGFTDVRSMTGGIDAWSREVDAKVPRYRM